MKHYNASGNLLAVVLHFRKSSCYFAPFLVLFGCQAMITSFETKQKKKKLILMVAFLFTFQLLARGKQEQFQREDNQLKLKFKSAYQDLCFISAAGKALSLGVATFIVVQTTRVRPEQYVQKNRVDAFRQQLSKGSIERTEYTPTNIVLNTLEFSERSIADG